MNLAVGIQKLFFEITRSGLSADGAKRHYETELEVFKDLMPEVGVTVDAPAWFKDLLS